MIAESWKLLYDHESRDEYEYNTLDRHGTTRYIQAMMLPPSTLDKMMDAAQKAPFSPASTSPHFD